MQPTPIQWTNFTNNPLRARASGSGLTKGGYASGVGHFCVKVSPGCKNCYSSDLQPRFGLPLFQDQRKGGAETFLDASKLDAVLRRKKPTKIFWCDMTDMFGEWVSNDWIAACFGVMAATPQHTHQVLTKRAKRMHDWFNWVEQRGEDGAQMFPDDPAEWRIHQMLNVSARKHGAGMPSHHGGAWPLQNVHLGVSAESQETADERIPHLLSTPAAVRWVSAEPLLSPIDFNAIQIPGERDGLRFSALTHQHDARFGTSDSLLAWIIVGGESGSRARGFDLQWARDIIRQCREAGVPVFCKQLGAHPREEMADLRGGYGEGPIDLAGETVDLVRSQPGPDWTRVVQKDRAAWIRYIHLKDSHGGDPAEWPEDLRVREFPPEPSRVSR